MTYITSLILNLSLVLTVCLSAYEVIPDEAKVPKLQVDLQARTTLKIKLSNGIEAIVVSDPTTPESAAALVVKAGSWHETKPGLAHFLEHMLFLGTEKYPEESSFDEAIGKYKGHFNAFTASDFTAFYFSVANAGFIDVLDIFAQFFQAPLFNPDGVNRELNAIDQEFKKNLDIDSYRELSILRQEANPFHPFHNFTSGNLVSLKGVSQEELKTWYKAAYSSDRMRLFVLSPLPVDQLVKEVESRFSHIPTSVKPLNKQTVDFLKPLFGKIITFEPKQNKYSLAFIWEVELNDREHRPEEVIAHIFGHEGLNGLSQILKNEGLATGVNVCSNSLSESAGIFQIEVVLTPQGLKEKDKVIGTVFGAIEKVQNSTIPQSIFDEVQLTHKLAYQNQNREDVADEALEVASTLPFENVASFPEKTYLIQSYDMNVIKKFADKLDPKRAVLILAAPKSATGVSYNKEEEWTKTPYRLDKLEVLATPSQFELPPANRFLPNDFDLISADSHFTNYDRVPKPERLIDDSKGSLYYWADEFYQVPETYMSFEIRPSAFQYRKAKNQALSDLFVKIFTFKLLEIAHEASLAGTDIVFKSTPKGYILNIDGYSDRSYEILNELTRELQNMQVTDELFTTQLEELKRDYQNQLLSPPYEQLRAYFLEDIVGTASVKQKMQSAKKVTLDEFRIFVSSLFEKAYTAGLVIGNISQEDAKEAAKLVLDLNKRGYPVKEQKQLQFRNIDKGPFIIDHNLKGENSALILAIEDSPFNTENRAINQLLGMGLRDAYFKALRTEQQTGYVVRAANEDVFKHLYQVFIIQSSTYSPVELLFRTEAFLDNYARLLGDEITEERFNQMKGALITSLKDKPQNLEAMGELLFKLGYEFEGNFNWIQERIDSLQALDYKTFIEKGAKLIGRQNPKRLAVFLSGSHFGSLQYKPLKAGSRN